MRSRFSILLLVPSGLAAQVKVPPPEEQIAAAVLPLPEVLRSGAGVRGYDAALKRITLRQSTNGMICTGDRPGDGQFDVRCYEASFLRVIDRRRELVTSDVMGGRNDAFEAEVTAGKIHLPLQPTAGYRMLGPISAFDPQTLTFGSAIERWQSVHFPYRTAAEIGLPVDREGVMPYVMASGTWWAHVMIEHTPPTSTPLDEPGRLGTVNFPTSGKSEAQADFIRGVLYLHSFEYDDAARSFRKAQEKDPTFAMAYWGEAMTYTHPIWNQQDLTAARAVLERLGPTADGRAAKAPTARERAWLSSVEALYGEGSKQRRDTLFAETMGRIAAEFPDDEALSFRALAIMGLNQGVRDVPAYMRAGAIALDVLQRNPDHPGAAHYVIHAFDDPNHAALGLNAARAYSSIAPGAAHAQHMTTHIFLALGMWPEVISQNVAAAGNDRTKWQPGHYTYWLHYGLLQAGRTDEAVTLLGELRDHAGPNASAMRRAALAQARAQQIVTAERWSDSSLGWTIVLESEQTAARAADGFARGYAALKRGELEAASSIATDLEGIRTGPGLESTPGLIAKELRAAEARARGDKPRAEGLLKEVIAGAATLPVEFGPPDFVKPPSELLGEWLLEDGRTADAKRAFTEALAINPGRLLATRGLSQASDRLASRGGR